MNAGSNPIEGALNNLMSSQRLIFERAIKKAYRAGYSAGYGAGWAELAKLAREAIDRPARKRAIDVPLQTIETALSEPSAPPSPVVVAWDQSETGLPRSAVRNAPPQVTAATRDEGAVETGGDAEAGASGALYPTGQSPSFVEVAGTGEDVPASVDPVPAPDDPADSDPVAKPSAGNGATEPVSISIDPGDSVSGDGSRRGTARTVPATSENGRDSRERPATESASAIAILGCDDLGVLITIDPATLKVFGPTGALSFPANVCRMLAKMKDGGLYDHKTLAAFAKYQSVDTLRLGIPALRSRLAEIGIEFVEVSKAGCRIRRMEAVA